MRKISIMLGQKYTFFFFPVLYFQIGVRGTSGVYIPPSYLRLAFLVCLESVDWVQQDIFEVILLNRCSMKEGKSERGNFKATQAVF